MLRRCPFTWNVRKTELIEYKAEIGRVLYIILRFRTIQFISPGHHCSLSG